MKLIDPRLALVAVLTVGLVGCSEGAGPADPAPSPAAAGVPADDDHGEPPDEYERLVAQIEARGQAGAEAAWKAGKPTFLLFSASW